MTYLAELEASLDGELFEPETSGYDAIRSPANIAYRHVRPRLVVLCRSASDVVAAMSYVAATGSRIAVRGGGHCFAGRSSTGGVVLDLSGLDSISVSGDGVATIGSGARLAQVYSFLHARGRTLPAGCGPTVGITGLTLGGGIGLLGRSHGLTCDHLIGAQVVLADGRVVECDQHREPDLFWALRGAGGGQFGVVTSLRFATVDEPISIRIEAHTRHATGALLEELVSAWQRWAPDAPDELTVNLTLVSDPGAPVRATLFGASTLDEGSTRERLGELTAHAGVDLTVDQRPGVPHHDMKRTLVDLDPREVPDRPRRIRSEFFSRTMSDDALTRLLGQLGDRTAQGRRTLTFTAMGGAYNRISEAATAFAHRGERFLLEHIADLDDPWTDRSWSTAHREGSGRVYANFPDRALTDWAAAYHGGNHLRLAAIKAAYDPDRVLDFPQCV